MTWMTKKTMDGLAYYYNTETKEVTWDNPEEHHELDNSEWTWVPHPTDFWQPAKIEAREADGSTVCVTEQGVQIVIPKGGDMKNEFTNGRQQNVPLWKLHRPDLKHVEEDLIMLEHVNDGSIIYNLARNYEKQGLYTWVGASHRVLVSINPYQRLPLYGDDQIKVHQEKSPNIDVAPHVFDIAEGSYTEMLFDGKNQSILISGESGAGKTEATKQCLKFWAKVAGSKNGVEEKLIQANPVLEAFGNAKTVRNDNSSRFGKYLEVQFNDAAAPVGGMITTFLLEKTRVAFQGKGERNFHIFYQLMAGADPQMRSDFGLGNNPLAFSFLAQSGCTAVEGVDDAADFAEVRKAMGTVGISENEQYEIFKILSGILWLGNVTFTGSVPANIVDPAPLETAALLLQLPSEILANSLTHKAIVSGSARQTQYQVPQNPDQSAAIRDALAKTLYSRLFDFIVNKINVSMAYSGNCNVVGVLDIYGFEIFEHNSFEQFCINYVNERLQQIFIELTVKGEQEEYHAEGMKWKDIKFFDNKIVCDLIEGSNPPGLFRVLDDICRTVHAADADTLDQKYVDKIKTMHHEHLSVSPGTLEFTVEHYAGSVTYDARSFPAKNKDTLFVSLVMCMQESASSFVLSLFPEDVSDDKKAPATAGTQIRQSASYLVKRLSACTPHYIRCIKPNDKKNPLDFNSSRVEHQVKYLGLLENVKVKRSGYAYRHFKDVFLRRYGIICTKVDTDPQPTSITAFVDWLKANCGTEVDAASEFEEGKTKIFVKNPETIYFLEELLYKRTDPEGYKLKVQEYKQREKLARQQQGKHGLVAKCLLQ